MAKLKLRAMTAETFNVPSQLISEGSLRGERSPLAADEIQSYF